MELQLLHMQQYRYRLSSGRNKLGQWTAIRICSLSATWLDMIMQLRHTFVNMKPGVTKR